MSEGPKAAATAGRSLKDFFGRSKADLVATEIINRIQSGSFKRGDALPPEMKLSEILGVSRSTVREAVKQLVTQNILEIHRGRGTYVTENPGVPIDPFGLRFHTDKLKLGIELCEIRMMIDPVLARNAALEATPAQIEKISEAEAEVEKCIAAGEPHEKMDVRFHAAIAECTDNSILRPLLGVVYSGIPYLIKVTERKLRDQAVTTHRMVLEAIKKHDPDAAFSAMMLHLEQNLNALKLKAAAEKSKKSDK